ncbi:hypothetical protein AO366_0406 [Moraxella catarrhalis]|nr:hypothetical protein AO366_0406 [Moraxella catarrhalis]
MSTNLNEPPFLGQFGGFYCPLIIQIGCQICQNKALLSFKNQVGLFCQSTMITITELGYQRT